MICTTIKALSAVLAAAAVAVSVASGASPTAPGEAQVFSLGTALAEYQQKHAAQVTGDAQVFSLGTALENYQQKTAQGGSVARPTTSGTGFDWGDAAIGGGIVAGAFLVLLGGIGAARSRHAAGSLSRT
jgi:opacity protein-like surface antigen